MSDADVVRAFYAAYQREDRAGLEALMAPDFTFSSPQDDRIDGAAFLERCYPNPDLARFDLLRVVAADGDVFVTYEAHRRDGTRFRNTEVLSLRDGRVTGVEVYFGWDVQA